MFFVRATSHTRRWIGQLVLPPLQGLPLPVGGAAAVASTGVGIPIAIAAGVVSFVAAGTWDRLVGEYLRFVGE